MLDFRILGPVEVIDGETALTLGGQKQRAVLAALLIDAGHVVSTDYLVDALWGERPPKTAATSLQNFVSQLRKALGPEVLVTKPPGYQLRLQPGQLDLDRFTRLVEEARAAGAEERSATLRKALALWRGAPFADFTFESFAQPEIARLTELRLSVLEERIDADLEAGRHTELVAELEPLVAEYPLRERLRALLMLALYRSGRQAEALQAYQDARSALVDELGIEPSPALAGCTARSCGRTRARPPRRRPARGRPLPRGRTRAAGGPGRPGPRRGRRRPRRRSWRERFDYPRERRGADPDLAVRQRDARLRPALRRAARAPRRGGRADRGPPALRLAAAAPARARRPAPAARDDELRPRARAGVARARRGVRRRVLHRVRAATAAASATSRRTARRR